MDTFSGKGENLCWQETLITEQPNGQGTLLGCSLPTLPHNTFHWRTLTVSLWATPLSKTSTGDFFINDSNPNKTHLFKQVVYIRSRDMREFQISDEDSIHWAADFIWECTWKTNENFKMQNQILNSLPDLIGTCFSQKFWNH